MEIIKKYKLLLIIALIVIAGVFFFFYRFYHNDVKALRIFRLPTKNLIKPFQIFPLSKTDDLESKAGDALIELNTKAALRLSSLIKNDAELMSKALEVARSFWKRAG